MALPIIDQARSCADIHVWAVGRNKSSVLINVSSSPSSEHWTWISSESPPNEKVIRYLLQPLWSPRHRRQNLQRVKKADESGDIGGGRLLPLFHGARVVLPVARIAHHESTEAQMTKVDILSDTVLFICINFIESLDAKKWRKKHGRTS